MSIDFPTYINKPKDDIARCIVCDNTITLDDWHREYIGKSGFITMIEKR